MPNLFRYYSILRHVEADIYKVELVLPANVGHQQNKFITFFKRNFIHEHEDHTAESDFFLLS